MLFNGYALPPGKINVKMPRFRQYGFALAGYRARLIAARYTGHLP